MDQPKSPVSRNGQNAFPAKAKLKNMSVAGGKRKPTEKFFSTLFETTVRFGIVLFSQEALQG